MVYRSLNETLRQRFGCKVYKLALDGGMTCPNRDGTLGTRGCLFCSDAGAGEFASPVCEDLFQQIEQAKLRVARKNKQGKYIAYFQSFTNTYAPLPHLERIFTKAICHPDIVALSVATRPDCLPPATVSLLEALNRRKPVWVELGLQTIHEKTARYLRRGYDLPVFDHSVSRLRAAGIEVVVHMILGLPGETPEDMVETARYIGRSGAAGIKLQLLHVLEGTDLAREWRAGRIQTLELEEYLSLLEACVQALPPEMVIHRLTGDGAKRNLLAPLWSGNKKLVHNAIQAAFLRDEIRQGSHWIPEETSYNRRKQP